MHRQKAELNLEVQKLKKLAKLSAPAELPEELRTSQDDPLAKQKLQRDLMNRMRAKSKGLLMSGKSKNNETKILPSKEKTSDPSISENVVEVDSDEEIDQSKIIIYFYRTFLAERSRY